MTSPAATAASGSVWPPRTFGWTILPTRPLFFDTHRRGATVCGNWRPVCLRRPPNRRSWFSWFRNWAIVRRQSGRTGVEAAGPGGGYGTRPGPAERTGGQHSALPHFGGTADVGIGDIVLDN